MKTKHIIAIISLLASISASAMRPEKDSLTNMPWQRQFTADLMTSGAQSVNEEDMVHVPVADLRKRLRGLFLSAQVLENCGGLVQSGVMTSPFFNSDQILIIISYYECFLIIIQINI